MRVVFLRFLADFGAVGLGAARLAGFFAVLVFLAFLVLDARLAVFTGLAAFLLFVFFAFFAFFFAITILQPAKRHSSVRRACDANGVIAMSAYD
jgi:hypothetical protein